MKRFLFSLAIFALLLPAAPRARAEGDVSIDFFYDNLGDNGSWFEVGDYGYCWQPNVAADDPNWRPYADGYWAYTDAGWTWVSNEDFGWATYHYGRWARLETEGWVWVPGREWGPAWVSWRTGGDYVGWAPLPPRSAEDEGEVVYEGRSITGRVDVDYDIGPSYYNFVDVRYIGAPVLRDHIFEPSRNSDYIRRTVNVTNITYKDSTVRNYGPDYDRLSERSAQPIRRLHLERENSGDFHANIGRERRTRVNGDQLFIAAPLRIQPGTRTAPPRSVKAKIATPHLERGWRGISDPKAKADLQQRFRTEDARSIPRSQNPAAELSAAPSPTAPVTPNEFRGRGRDRRPLVAPTAASLTSDPAAASAPTPPVQAERFNGRGSNRRGPNEPPKAPQAVAPETSVPATPAPTPNERRGAGKPGVRPVPTAPPAPAASAPESAPPRTGRQKPEHTAIDPINRPVERAPQEAAQPQPVIPRQKGSGEPGEVRERGRPGNTDRGEKGEKGKKKNPEATPPPAAQ